MYNHNVCVQSPSVQLGCSTVNAPSPAPQPATVSTSRRSARKSVRMAAPVLVTSHSLHLPCFTFCHSVTSMCNMVCVCVSVGKVLDGNRCVEVSQCSCVHMGRHFPPGSSISQDCNTWWGRNYMQKHVLIHRYRCTAILKCFLTFLSLQCVPSRLVGMHQWRLPG